MFKKLLLFTLSFLLLIVSSAIAVNSLTLPQSAYAMASARNAATTSTSGTAAADSFQRTVASGWGSADTGGWWTVVGSPWSWSVAPGAGSVTVGANAQEQAYLSSFTTQDVDVVQQVALPRCTGSSTNCDAYVLGRYSPAYSPTYYRVGVVQGAGRPDIFLRAQRSDGTSLGTDLDTGLPAASGAVVWLHVEFQGVNPTAVRARAWLDGTTEPSTWLLDTTDNNSAEQVAGMVGVQLQNEDTSASNTFQVENYQATGTATPVSVTPNPTGSTTAHWLYVVDDGQVFVYDIDNNHALVKQFPIPEKGKRGVAVAPNRSLLYITECGTSNCSGSHGSLLAYDLIRDVVAWIANYSFGVDQLAVTPDGSTIYMPHGADASDGTHTILDASDGKPIGSIHTGTNGHNTVASLDGTQVYLGGYTGSNFNFAHVVDPTTNQVTLNAGPTVNGVRPFTVNGTHTLMFTTSTNTCGFQVLSLTTGNVLYTITFSGSCSWTVSNAPSHGISLSPDEKRVYVMDAPLDQVEVYDVSGLPTSAPTLVSSVSLTSLSGTESPCQTYCEREGWVLNDLSGRYVYVGDTGNVVSTSTLSVVTTLPALQNTREMVEIDWTNSTTSATSTRFGLGQVTSSSPPTPTPTVTPSVTPTPTPTPRSTLAQDTFQRPNQSHWGTASDGQTWGGDANTASVFSINNNTGQVANGTTTYNAVLGQSVTDAEVLFTGSMNSFSNANLGAVLRWSNTNNWYKAYINGTTLVVQKKVNGATTIIGSTSFAATAGTSYTLRFRVVGTTLYARVWPTATTEPANWMITVTDTAFSSGFCGLRMQLASGIIASYTSFLATIPGGTPTPTPSPSPTVTPSPTPSSTPGSTLAQDTFQRPNQSHWGTASDGQTWGGDANTVSNFSIVNNTGQVSNASTTYSATLGPMVTNAEVVFTGSMSSYTNNNLGSVLRWTNGNNWYKAYISGASLIVQKRVNGATTILGSVPFTATANTSYTLRFRVVGTTLYARVWPTGTTEPTNWMIMVTDTSFSSGFCGLRMLAQNGTTATYTSFQATAQ
jgi:6-phosphogluconolactonase (cycloisomerase 2 family)